MSLLFQGLDYDRVDHNFETNGIEGSEIVFIIYGSTEKNGASVALAVRGFRPSLKLRLPRSLTLELAKIELRKFINIIYNINDSKRAIQFHVDIQNAQIEEKTDIYTYQDGQKDRYITLQFQSLASYTYFRQIMCALEHLEQYQPEITLEVVRNEIQQIDTICLKNKKKKTLVKEEITTLLQQKQKWESLLEDMLLLRKVENHNNVTFKEINLTWKMYDSASDVHLSFLKTKKAVTQWWASDHMYFQRANEHEIPLNAIITGTIHMKDLTARNDITSIAPFMQVSFDIETYSGYWVQTPQGDRREFPVPNKKNNTCFQIGLIFQRFGDSYQEYHLISMKRPSFLLGEKEGAVKVHRVCDERSVLVRFFQLVKDKDVDLFITYNGDGFDMNYIYHRAVMNNLLFEKDRWNAKELIAKGQYSKMVNGGPCATVLSRLPQKAVQLKYDIFAQGNAVTHFKRFVIPGRLHVDLYTYMQRNVKLQSYKLDAVAQEFLNDQKKDDMPIERLFKAFENDNDACQSQEIAKVGEYCLQDCALLYHLLNAKKLKVIESLMAISRVVYCPLVFLLQRGQQIKVFAQIDRISERLGFAIPNLIIDEIFGDDKKYQGATVLDPTSGFYFPVVRHDNDMVTTWSAENAISTLDFASLYPTIMMAFNICYSTIIYKESDVLTLRKKHNGIKIDEHRWEDVTKKHTKGRYLAIVQDKPAVLPTLLHELYEERKKTKKLMANERDPNKELLLDRLQYAHKLSLNSVYGFCASQMMSCTILASLVTCLGRRSLQAAIDGVALHYPGAELIYGDSVTGDTPILLQDRITGTMFYRCIDDICSDVPWETRINDGKEYKPCDYKIWSKNGFVEVTNLIRHKTSKRLFRVITSTGLVDVTEDHSLLSPEGKELKPTDVAVGVDLMHANLPFCEVIKSADFGSINKEYAWVMGLFFAYGCIVKSSWKIMHSDKALLQRAALALKHWEETTVFEIVRSNGSYHLVEQCKNTNVAVTTLFQQKWHMWFYDHLPRKKVPDVLLSSDMDIRVSFLEGYFAGTDPSSFKTTINHKLGAAGLVHLLTSVGFNFSINEEANSNDFIIHFDHSYDLSDEIVWLSDAITDLRELPATNDYVYDFTTASGHFAVGPGRLQTHNTDSIFVNFSTMKQNAPKTIEECALFSEDAAHLLTKKYFRPPMCLEFEKIYYCFKLISAKRYIGLKLEVDGHATKIEDRLVFKKPKLEAKGVISQRRDSIPLSRESFNHICDLHAYKGLPGIEESVHYLSNIVEQLSTNTCISANEYERFSITKKIQDKYENPFGQPQCVVAEKLRSRGKEVRSNDQIKYVILAKDDLSTFPDSLKGALVGKGHDHKHDLPITFRAEDVHYAAEHRIPLDSLYYLGNLKTTLDLIFNIKGIPDNVQEEVNTIWRQAGLLKEYPQVYEVDAQSKTLRKRDYKGNLSYVLPFSKSPPPPSTNKTGLFAFGLTSSANDTWETFLIDDTALEKEIIDTIYRFQCQRYEDISQRVRLSSFCWTIYIDKMSWKQIRHGKKVIVIYCLCDKGAVCLAHGKAHEKQFTMEMILSARGIQFVCSVEHVVWPFRPFPLPTNLSVFALKN